MLDDKTKQIQLAAASAEIELETGYVRPETHKHWLDRSENSRLREDLTTALQCEALIPAEQARIQVLLDKALAKPESEARTAEIEAREFQLWYIKVYLTRAADIAQARFEYFREIRTQADIEAEIAKCKADKAHWFEYYGWGYDPRARTPLSVVPFRLHPRQVDLVEELDDVVFNEKASLIIEKARDEGATELIVRWGIHCWLWHAGFSMLLSSRTEDEVDTKKKQGTLFERARFQLRRLPAWMRPEGLIYRKISCPTS